MFKLSLEHNLALKKQWKLKSLQHSLSGVGLWKHVKPTDPKGNLYSTIIIVAMKMKVLFQQMKIIFTRWKSNKKLQHWVKKLQR